jgi:beclin
MSFVEITQSQVVGHENASVGTNGTNQSVAEGPGAVANGESMNAKAIKSEKLFSILSSYSDIDHPICTECTSLLLQAFSARLATATRERDAYAGFLKSLQQTAATNGSDEKDKVEQEISDLEAEDVKTYAELLQLEAEKAALEGELADLEEESRQLEHEEEAFWASRNAHEKEVYDLTTELQSLQQKYAHDQQQLEKLQRTNVFNDTFCIGHDGLFATINGLRLGRLPNQTVEWAEINAAWGQTLLLLATVAERLGFQFKGYRLRPLGSTSRIEKFDYSQQAPTNTQAAAPTNDRSKAPPVKVTPLDLFSSGETAIGRVFNHRKFDTGMVAFLDCLAQLGDYVKQLQAEADGRPVVNTARGGTTGYAETKPVLPYNIEADKIGNEDKDAPMVSIKLGVGFQQDESFTRACKYVLTCCKFLLAYCSNRESQKR